MPVVSVASRTLPGNNEHHVAAEIVKFEFEESSAKVKNERVL